MLRVCILTETYHPVVGGGETQARLLAEQLCARNAAVCVLTRRSDGTFPAVERMDQVRVYRVGPVGRGQLKKWGLLVSTVLPMFRLRHAYDVLFVSGFRILGVPAVLVGRALGKRIVLKADSQGEMSGEFFGPGLARLGLRPSSAPLRMFLALRNAVLSRADAFVAITQEGARELSQAGVRSEAIHTMPNAVDTRRFLPADAWTRIGLRRKLGLPEAAPIGVYTGRLVEYKGLPLLVRVWQSIARAHPQAILVLVGEGGLDIHNCEDELRAHVKANGLQRCIVFAGAVADVSDHLRAADLFLYPTENDAFPSSLLEAMACGLPVVTTPVGAIGTIIDDERNGVLVRSGSREQLEAAVDRLLRDRELASRLGAAARETVLERYSADRIAGDYTELFESLVAGTRR
jgi:glycosyltransferase involved in cell wall biosynthesis